MNPEEEETKSEEKNGGDGYTLSQQMMGSMLEWSLNTLLDTVLFEKSFCEKLQAAKTEWRGLAELLYA